MLEMVIIVDCVTNSVILSVWQTICFTKIWRALFTVY